MATTSVARLQRSVDEVLADRDALETFKRWAAKDESRYVSAIELHFAIKQFRTIMERKPADGPSIAVLAHKKYISKKTGSCSFLTDSIRSEMSHRAHSIRNSPPSRDFFDPVLPSIDDHLKKIHANFVCSQAFFDLTKEINAALDATPSTSMGTPATIKKERASSLAASSASPSTSSGTMKSSSPFSPFHPSVSSRAAAIASATISSGFNPFRTYNIDMKQEPIDVDAAIASKRRAGQEEKLSFADKLGDRLKRLQDEMAKRGVQFARDLSAKSENFDDLTEESIDKDIDDYADRMDARGKSATSKRSDSRSPPSLPLTSPPVAPPSAYGTNGFAPPPSNRLRRKYMETMHNTTAVTGFALPPQSSPTAGTISKKGRPSIDHDSGSSGFYSGLPSSSSSAFSSHFSAPHFNTLRRPTHSHHTPVMAFDRPTPFSTLGRPSFVSDQSPSSFTPSPFCNILTPGASPSHNPERVHNGFATLPRSTGRVPSAPGSSTSSGSGKPDGKILLRVTVQGNRPMVFRAEPEHGGMTLKKFRTIFGIGKDRNKFFFKNSCEDDPSDYQWELVSDDLATVPNYHGSITAECKPALDSPE